MATIQRTVIVEAVKITRYIARNGNGKFRVESLTRDIKPENKNGTIVNGSDYETRINLAKEFFAKHFSKAVQEDCVCVADWSAYVVTFQTETTVSVP